MSKPAGIYCAQASCKERAEQLAAKHDIPICPCIEDRDLMLIVDEDGLSLAKDNVRFRGDYLAMRSRLKSGKFGQELLVKAARIKHAQSQTVVDATAGLGEDSVILAAAGFDVYLIERHPILYSLLEDALDRATEDIELAETIQRMHLMEGDSLELLPALGFRPDVVYLDPMFPARTKSAAVKKKFQLIHELEAPADDEDLLFGAALAAQPKRIVVKRPIKGSAFAGKTPSYSLRGKAIRYDCWAL